MTQRDRLAKQLAFLERIEDTVALGAATAIAALYFVWRLSQHVIAELSWSIPFFGVFLLLKLGFAIWQGKLEQAIRGADAEPELAKATARIVPRVSAPAEPIARPSAASAPPPDYDRTSAPTPSYLE